MQEALRRPCIADNSLLVLFVHTGYAALLHRIIGGPVFLSPSVLDERDPIPPVDVPRSEFLMPLYLARFAEGARYRARSEFLRSFAASVGTLWQPAAPTLAELALAARFSNRSIRAEVRARNPPIRRKRIELDAGEAEAAAIAASRGWTFLTEDQASVDLVRALYPDLPVLRSCPLLLHAVANEYVPRDKASELFNRRVVREIGFYTTRPTPDGGRESLRLRCDPPRCAWERE